MPDLTYKIEPVPSALAAPRAHVSLLFSWGEAARAVALREGESLVVGRSEPAQVILDDRSLSRAHARVSLRDGGVTLEDLDSTNGCSVNGAKVSQALVGEGDVAQLGAVELRISGALHPRAPGLRSHAAFMRELGDELTRGRLFGRQVSIVMAKHAPGAGLAASICGALRPVDRACSFAPGLTMAFLAELSGTEAGSWCDKWRSQHKGLILAIASYPALLCSAEELVSRALDTVHAGVSGELRYASELARTDAAAIILSPAMRRLYELVTRSARTTLPVLIQGETGSGKELVAQAVHARSPRAKGQFKALNCATIPTNLIESVLFGHERGAFTGADRQAQGIFEQAQGGTVFLDEVGELAPQAQAALLRVLEARRIVRVGGTKEIEVDVRVVAATHRDLAAMVAAGSFREDLMFRLDALTLRVPPLRERTEEIGPLAEVFLARARAEWGSTASSLSDDALDALLAYSWPGNVRQLKNVMERAVAVCAGELVELEDLPEHVWTDPRESLMPSAPGVSVAAGFKSLPDRVREFEVGLIREALEKAHGNQAQAARILGLPRRTLANKVHAYGVAG